MTETTPNVPVAKNAAVKIQLSSDRMAAPVTAYIPPEGEGAPLDIERLRKQIVDAGVTAEPDEFSLKKVLNYIRIGSPRELS